MTNLNFRDKKKLKNFDLTQNKKKKTNYSFRKKGLEKFKFFKNLKKYFIKITCNFFFH